MKARAKKRFGQHFLEDRSVIERIMRVINPTERDMIVEIGPGTGRMTDSLVEKAGQMVLIELDRDLAGYLRARYPGKSVELIETDVLRVDFRRITHHLPDQSRFRIVGNLPYNISTPLLFHLLSYSDLVHDMVFMVQKEVADRLSAKPGNKNYGRLTVMVGLKLDCTSCFDVAPESFDPPPKVDSSVIRLIPRKQPYSLVDFEVFTNVVRSAFAQRRKTIKNSLQEIATVDNIQAVQLDPNLRAENLSVLDFVNLSNTISSA